jgi:hypothetical protein
MARAKRPLNPAVAALAQELLKPNCSPPMILLGDDELERSVIVANCRMNRERDLTGSNGYSREVGCPGLAEGTIATPPSWWWEALPESRRRCSGRSSRTYPASVEQFMTRRKSQDHLIL